MIGNRDWVVVVWAFYFILFRLLRQSVVCHSWYNTTVHIFVCIDPSINEFDISSLPLQPTASTKKGLLAPTAICRSAVGWTKVTHLLGNPSGFKSE